MDRFLIYLFNLSKNKLYLYRAKIRFMKLFRICLIFCLVLGFQACGQNQEELNVQKRAEVLAVHDEVMPKMGNLKSLENRALRKAEEFNAMQPVDSVQVQAMKNLALELDQAYEEMFVWMRQYGTEDGSRSPEEIKLYLEDQMISVSKVNVKIKEVIAKADSLLSNQ